MTQHAMDRRKTGKNYKVSSQTLESLENFIEKAKNTDKSLDFSEIIFIENYYECSFKFMIYLRPELKK